MNLGEWARQQDIHPQTAYRWSGRARSRFRRRKMGKLILVGDLEAGRCADRLTAVCERVSSANQRDDLDRQVARVCIWAVANGSSIDRVVTEAGPGLNRKRRKLLGLVSGPKVTTILAEHRDRFARSAPRTSPRPLRRAGGASRDVTGREGGRRPGLPGHGTEVLTSFCARAGGRRAAATS